MTATEAHFEDIVTPGDIVIDIKSKIGELRLGGGLLQDGDFIIATKAGRLRHEKNKYWVESSQKRYIPNMEDAVIGIVVNRRFEHFLVDINGPSLASLPSLAFEGATRRNAPNIKEGAVVYARVVKTHRDASPELSCVDASGKASGYGQLKEGYLFDCSTGLARALLSRPTYPVLEALGKNLSFEVAVGLNGRVWVKGGSPATLVLVSNAIINSEFLSAAQQHVMVQKLIQRTQ